MYSFRRSLSLYVRVRVYRLGILLNFRIEYVVQGHRFNILEDIGCYPALYNTLPTYFLSGMWPIVIGVISSVYCSAFSLHPRYLIQLTLTLHSSLSSLLSSTSNRIQPIYIFESIAVSWSVLPVNGSGGNRSYLYNASSHLYDVAQCNRHSHWPLAQLGGHTFRILSCRTIPSTALAPKPPPRGGV